MSTPSGLKYYVHEEGTGAQLGQKEGTRQLLWSFSKRRYKVRRFFIEERYLVFLWVRDKLFQDGKRVFL